MLVQENGAKRPAPVRDMSALAAAAPELDLKTHCKIYVSFLFISCHLFSIYSSRQHSIEFLLLTLLAILSLLFSLS